jgi:hypothetical protein
VVTSFIFEYFGFEASSAFMYVIQAFWLVAFAVADRIANSPL